MPSLLINKIAVFHGTIVSVHTRNINCCLIQLDNNIIFHTVSITKITLRPRPQNPKQTKTKVFQKTYMIMQKVLHQRILLNIVFLAVHHKEQNNFEFKLFPCIRSVIHAAASL